LAVLRQVQAEMDAGQLPARPLFNGLCLLVAGALLLTPGFITDGIGFLLLFPPARKGIAALLLARLGGRISAADMAQGPPNHEPPAQDGAVVIDGEFEEIPNTNGKNSDRREGPPSLPDSS